MKYRGFNQATVTGVHLGPGGAAGFQKILLRVPSQAGSPDAPNAPKCPCQRPVRIEPQTRQPRCAAANRPTTNTTRNPQPATRSSAGPELIRLPADCPQPPCCPASSTHSRRQVGVRTQQPPAPRWATLAAFPKRARLSILEIRIDVSLGEAVSPLCCATRQTDHPRGRGSLHRAVLHALHGSECKNCALHASYTSPRQRC